VTINKDVLTVVFLSSISLGVVWGWLVNGPVVVWWVLSGVGDLSKFHAFLLVIFNFVASNEDVVSKLLGGHRVLHQDRIDKNWDSLSELGLLVENDFIVSNSHVEVKSSISHFVLPDYWVNGNWDSSLALLNKIGGSFDNVIGDWGWFIGDKVLEGSLGHVFVVEEVVNISISLDLQHLLSKSKWLGEW